MKKKRVEKLLADYSKILQSLINNRDTETIKELQQVFNYTTSFALEDIRRGNTWPNSSLRN